MGNRCQQKYLVSQNVVQTKLDHRPAKLIAVCKQFAFTEDFSSTRSFNVSSIKHRTQPQKHFDVEDSPLNKSVIFKDSQIVRKTNYVIFKIADSAVMQGGQLMVHSTEQMTEGKRFKIGYKQGCNLRLPIYRKWKKRLQLQQAQLQLQKNRLVLTSANRHSIFKKVALATPFPLQQHHFLLLGTTLITLTCKQTLVLGLNFIGGHFQQFVLSQSSFTIGSKSDADLILTEEDPLARDINMIFSKREGGEWIGELREGGGLCWQGVQRLEGEDGLAWLMGFTAIQLRLLFAYA